MTIKGQHHWWY